MIKRDRVGYIFFNQISALIIFNLVIDYIMFLTAHSVHTDLTLCRGFEAFFFSRRLFGGISCVKKKKIFNFHVILKM